MKEFVALFVNVLDKLNPKFIVFGVTVSFALQWL